MVIEPIVYRSSFTVFGCVPFRKTKPRSGGKCGSFVARLSKVEISEFDHKVVKDVSTNFFHNQVLKNLIGRRLRMKCKIHCQAETCKWLVTSEFLTWPLNLVWKLCLQGKESYKKGESRSSVCFLCTFPEAEGCRPWSFGFRFGTFFPVIMQVCTSVQR